jgi:ACS family hexuronate transporter-like MFS transporter
LRAPSRDLCGIMRTLVLEPHLPGRRPLPRVRYWILALLLFSTLINYVDRQVLSVLKPTLSDRFGWDAEVYATIVVAWQLAYAVGQFGSGWLFDRIGTRRGFAITISLWSFAGIVTSLARGAASFSVCRALLGLGEAGNWPGAVKCTREWFPPRERAFATGVWNFGSATGAIVAAPLVAWITLKFGWQFAFVVTGLLGFVWLAAWLAIYWPPHQHPRLGEGERALLASAGGGSAEDARPVPWRDLLVRKDVWGLIVARLISDPVWWFFVFWLPGQLHDQHGMSLAEIGATAWIPFLAADLGSLSGGATSSLLIRRGVEVVRARKIVMVGSALLMPVAIAAPFAKEAALMLLCVSIAAFAHQSWASSMLTLPADLLRGGAVASCTGITGTGAALGGMAFSAATGWVVLHYGYSPVGIWSGLMHPLAAVVVLLLVRTPPAIVPPVSSERGAP